MADNDNNGGDLYESDMGEGVTGGSVEFNEDSSSHSNVHGDGAHFSWDTDSDGNVSGVHGTVHDNSGNERW